MSGKYEISIVTPFHNVNMDFFKRGFESIKNQDIGFEKIEWIVVVHNSEKYYEEEVQKLLEPYDNFIVKILHNDKCTPSSPRNVGMDMATAKYIGFLDADDCYLPNCFSVVLKHMKEEGAQITSFRREYELESEDAFPITEITLWNQTREKIVLTRDSWDEEKMFNGLCGMVTSKIYDREFLVENNIRFDEDILFAEDYLFIIESYNRSEKVMYLPQLIGYHYFINSGSMVQSAKKDGPTLISYAKGYTKIFDKGLEYGMYMNTIMSRLCFTLSRFMVSNDELTFEDRVTIKNLLEKYILMTTEFKKSKLFSDKLIKDTYQLPREVILNPQKWADPSKSEELVNAFSSADTKRDVLRSTLADILEKNVDTDIGQQYGFASIMTLEGYQSKVPLHDFNYYKPLIKLTTRIGESQIFTSEKVLCYTVHSNVDGVEKLFPHVTSEIEMYGDAFEEIVRGKNNFVLAESLPSKFHYNDQALMNSVWGIALSTYDNHHKLRKNRATFTSPDELLFPEKAASTEYVRALFALLDPDVEQIVAPSTMGILVTFGMIEYAWKDMCDDIDNGSLGVRCDVDKDLLNSFNKRLKKNPQRAAELRKIFEEGFNTPIAPRIWPKLTRVVANELNGEEIYRIVFKKYLGDIERIQGFLFSNELVLGKEIKGTNTFVILPEYGFYEFRQGDNVYSANDVVLGEEYEIIITTYSGLYRFKTGKVVKIEGFDEELPVFSWSYDIGNAMTIRTKDGASGVLTPNMLAKAVVNMEKELGVYVTEFAFADRNIDSDDEMIDMVVILEAPPEEKLMNRLTSLGTKAVCEKLNHCIRKQCKAYSKAVDEGRLKLEVLFGEPETNFVFSSRKTFFNDLVQDRITPAKFLNNADAIRFFTSRVL